MIKISNREGFLKPQVFDVVKIALCGAGLLILSGCPTPPPNISPPAGTYSCPQTITITDAVPGATIFYSLDGSSPTTSSAKYGGPFPVPANPYSLIDSIPHGPIQELVIESAGKDATVKGGFGVRLSPTLFMYGRRSGGFILDLGLSTTADQKESISRQDLLVLRKKFNLIIADWYAGQVLVRPDE